MEGDKEATVAAGCFSQTLITIFQYIFDIFLYLYHLFDLIIGSRVALVARHPDEAAPKKPSGLFVQGMAVIPSMSWQFYAEAVDQKKPQKLAF